MAASPIPAGSEVVDLREFHRIDLQPLLEEQAAFWSEHYHWDFGASKDVILRFIDTRSLYGYVLLCGGQIAGYSYFVHENCKVLVGDFFITESERTEQTERFLLHNTLHAASKIPGVIRIEGQLLALSLHPAGEVVRGWSLAVFERVFMLLDDFRGLSTWLASGSLLHYRSWADRDLDAAADLICQAYRNHIDSQINDQYRSITDARRFLVNSTQYPGCGVFMQKAGYVAVEPVANMLCGICLGNLVQPQVGHITQLCVAPYARGHGVGRALLRHSVQAFRDHGCDAVSLTVTNSNQEAVHFYERLGFGVLRRFFAFVAEIP